MYRSVSFAPIIEIPPGSTWPATIALPRWGLEGWSITPLLAPEDLGAAVPAEDLAHESFSATSEISAGSAWPATMALLRRGFGFGGEPE